ncbi:MAG: serine/threonine protein kinase [Kofleriaceae bacterium]|nr:serine/threonine protein kinase [Kofleriaceae bacterium]
MKSGEEREPSASEDDPDETALDHPPTGTLIPRSGEQTAPTAPLDVPPVASDLAWVAAGKPPAPSASASRSISLTTAADAMRDEEIERTRLFISMGWVITAIAMCTVPFVDAPRGMTIMFITGLVIGVIVSVFYHRSFADPLRYTDRALVTLSVVCMINGHLAVLFFGTYSGAPMLVVVGIHFVARTELRHVARWIFVTALICYATIAGVIVSGLIDDPGVFASDRIIGRAPLAAATVFVLGTYVLAYYTARTFRTASLTSIEELQRATRLASQREALMEELRADLERALRVGGPGRYTDQVVGNFKLGIVLGRGAMGEVYEAEHVGTGAQAAVKLLRREQLADPTQVARFFREVRASAALISPHVVRVLDASVPEEAVPFLAMERLHGQTLGELLRREPRLPPAETLEVMRHAAAGIDAAAAAGIVHRDLKPQNLFHTAEGLWKILDFGVATLRGDSGTLTQGEAVGTPYYMAPEQAQGLRVDSRADLYALAAIAYRALTGRYPFTGPDTPALLYAVVHRMPPRPGELADLHPDVDRWFALALAKSPDARFATGEAFVVALQAALAGELDPKLRRRGDALIRKQPWENA